MIRLQSQSTAALFKSNFSKGGWLPTEGKDLKQQARILEGGQKHILYGSNVCKMSRTGKFRDRRPSENGRVLLRGTGLLTEVPEIDVVMSRSCTAHMVCDCTTNHCTL